MVVVSLAVNLTAQTIEQVISKRRKLMCDMCDEVRVSTRQYATTAGDWGLLRDALGGQAVAAAERLLNGVKSSIERRPPEFYNVNSHLVDTATALAGTAEALEKWGDGLQQVLHEWSASYGVQKDLGQLLLASHLDFAYRGHGGGGLDGEAAYGLAALVFLSTSLEELSVLQQHLGDAGVAAIAAALAANPTSRLKKLHLAQTGAGERAGKAILAMLSSNTSLTQLHLNGNKELPHEVKKQIEQACHQRALKLHLL